MALPLIHAWTGSPFLSQPRFGFFLGSRRGKRARARSGRRPLVMVWVRSCFGFVRAHTHIYIYMRKYINTHTYTYVCVLVLVCVSVC